MTTGRIIQITVVTVTIVVIVLYNIRTYKEKEDIKDGHGFTVGKIERCFHIGASRYVEYSYVVRGMVYKRTILDHRFRDCENSFEACKNKRFWVAYATSVYSHSLINVDTETDGRSPGPPDSLAGFK